MIQSQYHNCNTGVWYLGPLNKNGIRSVIFIESEKPKYLETRHLKSGNKAYYWCAPSWAKKNGFLFSNEALGVDYQLAMNKAHKLNAFLEDWRQSQKKNNKIKSRLDKQNRSSKPIKRQLSN